MKKLAVISMISLFMVGCATSYPVGGIFTELKLPVQGVTDGDVSYTKVGVATSESYVAMIATGDSSIKTAVENGGITKIKYIDWDVKNILGVYGKYTTTVYGD